MSEELERVAAVIMSILVIVAMLALLLLGAYGLLHLVGPGPAFGQLTFALGLVVGIVGFNLWDAI